MKRMLFITPLLLLTATVGAQTDKAEADSILLSQLTARMHTENWHPDFQVQEDQLRQTPEEGICILPGDSFQIRSLRSDVYVYKHDNRWQSVNDARYPMETMVNLLLNRIDPNQHPIELRLHQYGGKIHRIVMPMQNLYDIFARHMQLYCSVTAISTKEIKAVLVFHHSRLNFIHMIEVKADPRTLSEATSVVYGEMYTNIPQGNIKSLFNENQ